MGARFSVFSRFWKFLRRVFRFPRKGIEAERGQDDTPRTDTTLVSEPEAARLAEAPPGCNEDNAGFVEISPPGNTINIVLKAYDLEDVSHLTIGTSSAHHRAGSTSSCSGDESDDQAKASAEDQLSSIPAPDEPLHIEPRLPVTPEEPPQSVSRPVQLFALIEAVGPRRVFDHLRIKDVLAVGKVDRYLKATVDNYFNHTVLPQSEIYYYIDHIMEHDGPSSEEYQRLYPVIRRIEKTRRVFPDGRVVFEPKFEEKPRYTYKKDSFKHVEIKFHLVGLQEWPPRDLPLDCPLAARTRYSYKAEGYRKRHKLPYKLPYTAMHQFIRFDTFKDSPIYVFYKGLPGSHGETFALHAISIPLNFLRQSLCSTE